MLLAVVLFTAAGIHGATVLCAMRLGASMRMFGMFAAFVARTTGMVRAMGTMVGYICAMFGTNRIVAAWMISAMRFTVMLTNGFMLAMSDASLAFFAFGFFAMLNAIMLGRIYLGLMIGAMLRLHFRRSHCRRCNRRRDNRAARYYCGGRCRSGGRVFFRSGAAG